MLDLLDVLGAALALITTLLYIKADSRAWPVGLSAILINIYLYYQTGIFADAGLECFYLVSTFYGWDQWVRGGEGQSERAITSITAQHAGLLVVLGLLTYALLLGLLEHVHSQIIVLDALTTTLSLIAQWLLCRKVLQCWLVWLVADALYVGMYIAKGLPIHGLGCMVYVVLAVVGYVRWRGEIQVEMRYAHTI